MTSLFAVILPRCKSSLLWYFFAVGLHCGTDLQWGFFAAGLLRCGASLLWDFFAVRFLCCEAYLLWFFFALRFLLLWDFFAVRFSLLWDFFAVSFRSLHISKKRKCRLLNFLWPIYVYIYIYTLYRHFLTGSTAQGGGRSFKYWLLWWITDGRANPLMDRTVVGVVFFGVVAMVAVVTSPQLLDLSICLSVYLQDWKRSYSARLPQLLTLTASKKKQVCKTSAVCQLDYVKNEAILRDFLNFRSCQHQKLCSSTRLPSNMESWLQSQRPRTNALCDFSIPPVWSTLKYRACNEKVTPGHTKCCTCHPNHLPKTEDLTLQNATPRRKSAPGPPNSSDEHVSCTALATQNAFLIPSSTRGLGWVPPWG